MAACLLCCLASPVLLNNTGAVQKAGSACILSQEGKGGAGHAYQGPVLHRGGAHDCPPVSAGQKVPESVAVPIVIVRTCTWLARSFEQARLSVLQQKFSYLDNWTECCVPQLDERPDGDEIQDALLEITGGRSVPRVFIGGKFFGGGDDTVAALKNGKLEKAIADARVPVAA